MPEPWKLMLGLAGLLVVFGVFAYFGISEPAEIAAALIVGTLFGGSVYVGFRIGRRRDFGD